MPKETKALREGTSVQISAEAYRFLLRRQGELQALEGKKRNILQVIDHVLFDRPQPPVEVERKS